MSGRNVFFLVFVLIVTAVITGSAVFLWQNLAIDELKLDNQVNQEQLEQEKTNLQVELDQTIIDMTIPEPGIKIGWEVYFPKSGDSSLIGKNTDEIKELLGWPEDYINAGSNEIWAYMPYNGDPSTGFIDAEPTGVILYFEDEVLVKTMINEYNGPYALLDEVFLTGIDLTEDIDIDTTGWLIYTDTDYNYTLKYPEDWMLVPSSGSTDLIGQYKYVQFKSPDDKYLLHFGLRKKGESINIFGRTGVAGDGTVLGDVITMAGQEVQLYNSLSGNRIDEVFLVSLKEGEGNQVLNNEYEITGYFYELDNSVRDVEMNLPEYKTAKVILGSIYFINN